MSLPSLLFFFHSIPLYSTPFHSVPYYPTPPHSILLSTLHSTTLYSTPLHSTQCFIPFHSTTPHHTTPHHSIPFQSTPLHSTSTQLSSSLASFSFGCNHRVQATTRYLDFSCSALPSLSVSLSQFYFSPFFVLLYPIPLSSSPLLLLLILPLVPSFFVNFYLLSFTFLLSFCPFASAFILVYFFFNSLTRLYICLYKFLLFLRW